MKQVFKQSFRDAKIAEREMTEQLRKNYRIGVLHGALAALIVSIVGFISGML